MASVEVFADDAVLGRFPHVSAKTGEPADGILTINERFGGVNAGIAVLLLFLGPLGWLVLLLLAATRRHETLTVRVPYSDASVDRETALGRMRWTAFAVGIGFLTLVFFFTTPLGLVFGIAAAVALVVAIVTQLKLTFTQVAVDIDASRRWVTLYHVHPAFAAAVRATLSPTPAPA